MYLNIHRLIGRVVGVCAMDRLLSVKTSFMSPQVVVWKSAPY